MTERRDVRRNRLRIVDAATEVFCTAGADAPLELVARRAGVGRGTLYRHFPGRSALIAAVLERRIAALEGYAAEYDGDDLLEHLLVEICALQRDAPGLMVAVRSATTSRHRVDEVIRRTQVLVSSALDRARGAGVLRSDVTPADVFLAVAMIDGAVSARHGQPMALPSADRALELVFRSLRTEHRMAFPLPVPGVHLARAQR